MNRIKDYAAYAVAIALLVAIIGGSAWVWTSAPCGLWKWSKAGDMPARCLSK